MDYECLSIGIRVTGVRGKIFIATNDDDDDDYVRLRYVTLYEKTTSLQRVACMATSYDCNTSCLMLYLNFLRLYLYLCLVIHYRAMIYNLDLKGTVVALMQFLLLMSRSGVL